MELLVGAVLAGIALAIVILVVLYRAISNLIDWLILTFGNPDAVSRVKLRRKGEPPQQWRGGGGWR